MESLHTSLLNPNRDLDPLYYSLNRRGLVGLDASTIWPNSSSNSSSPDIPPLAERVIEALILSVIFVVALLGNILLWIVVIKHRTLRTVSNALVLCLSSADLLISVSSMPVTIVTISIGEKFYSDALCVALGFISMCTFIGSVMSLAAISINRYVMIVHPSKFKGVYTKMNTGFFIVGVWTLAMLLALPPLTEGWGVYDFLPNQSFCFCDWTTSISYTFFMVGVCFGGPCTVMTYCYFKILQVVRKSRKRVASMSKPSMPTVKKNAASIASKNAVSNASKNANSNASKNVISNNASKNSISNASNNTNANVSKNANSNASKNAISNASNNANVNASKNAISNEAHNANANASKNAVSNASKNAFTDELKIAISKSIKNANTSASKNANSNASITTVPSIQVNGDSVGSNSCAPSPDARRSSAAHADEDDTRLRLRWQMNNLFSAQTISMEQNSLANNGQFDGPDCGLSRRSNKVEPHTPPCPAAQLKPLKPQQREIKWVVPERAGSDVSLPGSISEDEDSNSNRLNGVSKSARLKPTEKSSLKRLAVPLGGSKSRKITRKKNRSESERRRKEEELKLTKSFLVVILVFVICWMPFCITMFWSVFAFKFNSDNLVPRPLDMATLLLGYANSCCNPIIYGVMNKRFRAGYKAVICGWRRKSRTAKETNSGIHLNTSTMGSQGDQSYTVSAVSGYHSERY